MTKIEPRDTSKTKQTPMRHPPKRRKIEYDCEPGLQIVLNWMEDQLTFTTINLLLCCKALRGEREVRTNRYDVCLSNLEFFEWIGEDRYTLCAYAAGNGDLKFLNTIIKSTDISMSLYYQIRNVCLSRDQVLGIEWVSTKFHSDDTDTLMCSATVRDALNIIKRFATDENMKHTTPSTLRVFEWVSANLPNVVKLWEERITKYMPPLYAVEISLLDHLLKLEWNIDFKNMYRRAHYSPKILKWIYKNTNVELQFDFQPLVRCHYGSGVFRSICDYHGVDFTSYRLVYTEPSSSTGLWLKTEIKTLHSDEFVKLCCDTKLIPELTTIQPDGSLWDVRKYTFMALFQEDSCLESVKYICSRCEFKGSIDALFTSAIKYGSLEVCKYLHEYRDKDWWDIRSVWTLVRDPLIPCENTEAKCHEKLDWLNSISPLPLGAVPLLLALQCICKVYRFSFSWILPLLAKEDYKTCSDYLFSTLMPNTHTVSLLLVLYEKYSVIPEGFVFESTSLHTEREIQFVVDNKLAVPEGFQPTWPNNFQFFKTNLPYFGWDTKIVKDLMHNWSESNFQLYLTEEEELRKVVKTTK